ncbi:hypothetical protein VCHENC02_3581A, partial [Vibrio harveyi]
MLTNWYFCFFNETKDIGIEIESSILIVNR